MTSVQEQEAFREEVRAFILENYDPTIESQSIFPQMDSPEKTKFAGRLADRGWLGISWPAQYGGRDLDPIFQLILQDELDYVRHPSLAFEVGLVGNTLLHYGSEALKREFLPRIANAEIRVALGYSEPDGGSDLASLKTRAVRDGDVFIVDGQKMWTSGAHFADVIWLAVRTDPTAERHRGISVLLVDADSPGISITPVETMVGDMHRTNMVYFDGVRVPASRLVGEVDAGWTYITEALNYERVSGAPFGGLQRDFDELLAWWQECPHPTPAMEHLVVETVIRLESVRTHLQRSLDTMSRGEVPDVDASMLKVGMSETRQWIAEQVLNTLGPPGLLTRTDPDSPLGGRFEETWRSEIVTTIAGGANEVLRDMIARRGLGLPRAARGR